MKYNYKSNELDPPRPARQKFPVKKPACPFCDMPVERPRELELRRPSEMPVGSCTCGAVYAYDASGRNLGTAFNEALVFGCDMDWDLAFSLLPGDDYLQEIVEHYDYEMHLVVPGGVYEGRRIAGALYFIRLHRDIQEVTGEGVQQKLNRARPVSGNQPAPGPGKKKLSRKELAAAVANYHVDLLREIAGQDKKILHDLQRFLYSASELERLKAADITGQVASVIARRDPAAVSRLLQRLLTAIRDTAASSWGAIDTMGEIIGCSPALFAGYVPELQLLLARDKSLQPPVLKALARIAEAKPDLIINPASSLLPFLEDDRPDARGYAALLFSHLQVEEARKALEALRGDCSQFKTYRDGEIWQVSIGQVAAKALEKL